MAAVVHKVEREIYLPDGTKVIVGSIKMSNNYYAGGDSLNLANYFANAAVHFAATHANGWMLSWNTASSTLPDSGKIVARSTTGNAVATPIIFECAANTDLSTVNAVFYAAGQPK